MSAPAIAAGTIVKPTGLSPLRTPTRSRMPSGSGVPCRSSAAAPNAYPVTPFAVICASAENAARAPDRRSVAPGV